MSVLLSELDNWGALLACPAVLAARLDKPTVAPGLPRRPAACELDSRAAIMAPYDKKLARRRVGKQS